MGNYIPIHGNKNNPVILVSGILGIGDSSKTRLFYNKYIANLQIVERNGGRLTLKVQSNNNGKVVVLSCLVMQAESQKITDDTASVFGRNVGAHWFSSNFNSGSDTIIIHETHVEDKDNDTWDSTIIDKGDILSISIIIFGYIE